MRYHTATHVLCGVMFNDYGVRVTGNQLTLNAATSLTQSGAGALQIDSAVVIAANTIFTGTGTGAVTINGVISESGGARTLTKTGSDSTYYLTGANTYTGLTTVSAGVLNIQNSAALGDTSGNTTVSSGAQLELQGNITVAVGEDMTITGTGITSGGLGTGAIQNISGDNTIAGIITLAAAASISSESGTLTLSGNITKSGGGKAIQIGYASADFLGGTGTIVLSGGTANLTGTSWTQQSGTLVLSKTADVNAIDSTFYLGNNDSGALDSVVCRLDANGQIATVGVNVYATGLLNINGKTDTIGALLIEYGEVRVGDGGSLTISTLSMKAGEITTGTGTLTLGGTVTGVADGNPSPSGAVISGNLALGGNRTFTIADTATVADDMLISAVVSGAFTLTKGGAGNLTLSGDNTYTGLTTVSANSFLTVAHANALGTTAGATTVGAAGQLNFKGDITLNSGEAITITSNNTVTANLNNTSGNNSFSGTLTLAGATGGYGFGSDSGTLTIGSALSTSKDITKFGTGTVVLSGNSTGYTGDTTVSAGTLTAAANNALGTTGGSTTVSDGASLGFQGGITYSTAEAVSITGTGVSSSGALKNISGNNSFAGNVTMTGHSSIGADADTLTLSGVVSGAFNLTKVGSGAIVMTGVNTFSGTTTISAGTLEAGAAGALGSTSNVTISSGGTLLLSGSGNRVNDGATVTLAGGTIDANNMTETFGAMTLTANSVIQLEDVVAGSGDITFASATYSAGTLTIYDWTGVAGSGGTDDRIFITAEPTQAFLDAVTFDTFGAGAQWLSGTGELVPIIPEPGTVVGGIFLAGLLGYHFFRRRFLQRD